ncbi:hypothetical protein JCM10450v2_002496 [Rhodotorula kratochvilovae]
MPSSVIKHVFKPPHGEASGDEGGGRAGNDEDPLTSTSQTPSHRPNQTPLFRQSTPESERGGASAAGDVRNSDEVDLLDVKQEDDDALLGDETLQGADMESESKHTDGDMPRPGSPRLARAREPPAPCFAPPAGSIRRKLFDRVLATVPDVHPAYLLSLIDTYHVDNDDELIIAELQTSDYPLANGGYKDGGIRPAFVAQLGGNGTVNVTCQCCVDSVAPAFIGRCENGHPFCSGCLTKDVEATIGSRRGTVSCFALAAGCPASFPPIELKRTVRPELLDALEAVQAQNELDEANLPGLEKCPRCPYAAVLDERETVFPCENCMVVYCRTCRKKSHGARPCNEPILDELGAKHAVEEALSNAVVHKCPRCEVPYVLTDGCNKVTCAVCGARFCHVCSKRTTDPAHWHEGRGFDDRCPAFEDIELRAYQDAQAARARALTSLAARSAPLPAADSLAALGPSAPRRTLLDATRFAAGNIGAHVFRSQRTALDTRPDWLPLPPPPAAPRAAGSGRKRQRGWEDAQREEARERPRGERKSRGTGGSGAAGYGYGSAGTGVFGGGGWGGAAGAGAGEGRWTGGKGTKADGGGSGGSWSAGGDGADARDEPLEVKRQRLMTAAIKRQAKEREGPGG